MKATETVARDDLGDLLRDNLILRGHLGYYIPDVTRRMVLEMYPRMPEQDRQSVLSTVRKTIDPDDWGWNTHPNTVKHWKRFLDELQQIGADEEGEK